ncbi:MAG: HD domain-containing protein [Actinomycetaceae bacterium]|nr:HD domain-containing protein [Actinomycetaceae bacterium]
MTFLRPSTPHPLAAAAFEPAVEFLRAHLFSRPNASAGAQRYRFEHCLRVARVGREVARGEGLDEDLLTLGCLLHDIGKYDAEKDVDHGRAGALVVADFLAELGWSPAESAEVVQGIAMHVDGLSNPRGDEHGTDQDAYGRAYLRFDTEPSILARSIGECDNVDRFGAYRVYDTMRYVDFLGMSTAEQQEWISGYLEQLRGQRKSEYSTATVTRLWQEAIDVQLAYFTRLLAEIS